MNNIMWKKIANYPNYEISNAGEVRNTKTKKILKYCLRRGYPCITLCQQGIASKFNIHRLVAQHFIANPHNKPQVNHINGDKLTNTAINLEWVTCSENLKHAYSTGLKEPYKPIGSNKGTSSKYMYVTHSVTEREDKYIAKVTSKTLTKSKSFSTKKYRENAELLAAEAANLIISTYPEFSGYPVNVL